MFPAIATRIIGLWLRLFRMMGEEARIRRAERQLQALDPRLLRDLGIEREQIGGILRPARGEQPVIAPAPDTLVRGAWLRS